jgi:hypothetical protein
LRTSQALASVTETDDKPEVLHVCIGVPGRVNDGQVFRASNLLAAIPTGMSILGDGAYPFGEQVITPYSDDGTLTPKMRDYNFAQSSSRMCVERFFGALKGRFRILLFVHYRNLKTINHIILVCCQLHNLCLGRKDTANPDEFPIPSDDSSESEDEEEPTTSERANQRSVKAQRDRLVHKMFG